jgi:D-alanyl-D-alanine carboxypeptidase
MSTAGPETSSGLTHPIRTTTATGFPTSSSALKPIDPTAFRAAVDRAALQLLVPGGLVMLRTAQGKYVAGTGTTKLGTQQPPAADTHFRIASNTKTMTAALIVLLAQEGKLRFSDPVSIYVHDVPNGNNITVEQLLKMRSALWLHRCTRFQRDPGRRAHEGVDTAGGINHRVPAPAGVRTRHRL